MIKGNILKDAPLNSGVPESFEPLIQSKDLLIERIVTMDSFESPGEWYDQERDEWVLLMEGSAELEFENQEIINLNKGDYVLIPARKRHRVRQVSGHTGCIWLAVHGNFK